MCPSRVIRGIDLWTEPGYAIRRRKQGYPRCDEYGQDSIKSSRIALDQQVIAINSQALSVL